IAVTAPISRVMFFFLKKQESISKEELEHVLKRSEEHGVLDKDESELMCGYLNLQDTMVKEIMNPREDVLYYNIQNPLSKLVILFVNQKCSRIPVCDGDLQNILGVISGPLFFLHKPKLDQGKDLKPILTRPFYIPESSLARTLLRRLEENRQEIAIVV